jgi:hypothetical protein
MAEHQRDPERPSGVAVAARPGRSAPAWPGALAVGLVALAAFGYDLAGEPHFMDESAYFSQSYFAELFASGRWNDPLWLEYAGLDLPPLPKYLIGGALAVAQYRTPGPAQARAWYDNALLRFEPPGALTIARVPTVLVGALGCIAVYGIGVLVAGRRVGALAALLLVINPLYRLLARRAMSDVPCEAFLLAALFFALWGWKRWLSGRPGVAAWASAVAAGACAGLALLSKLSGALALMVVAAWAVLAFVARPGGRAAGALAGAAVSFAVAALVFVAGNPFLTAHPQGALPPGMAAIERASVWQRARMMADLRVQNARGQQVKNRHNALLTPWDKVSVVAVQGFGRFGPFGPAHNDSTKRYDRPQDWGAWLWAPCVVAGAVWAVMRGRSQAASGAPPTAWALLAYGAVALGVVTAYLPLAWDRYFLSLQAPSALLVSGAAVACVDGVGRVLSRRPEEG